MLKTQGAAGWGLLFQILVRQKKHDPRRFEYYRHDFEGVLEAKTLHGNL